MVGFNRTIMYQMTYHDSFGEFQSKLKQISSIINGKLCMKYNSYPMMLYT